MRVTEPYTIFPRKMASGKTVYYYQFRLDDGTRSGSKSTGCTTLSSARRMCNKLYNSGGFSENKSVTFENYTKDFFSKENRYYKWRLANQRIITDETLLAYNKALTHQLIPFFKNYELCKINTNTVKEWVVWASEKWSAKTINNAQGVLGIITRQALESDIINKNPVEFISFRKTHKKKRQLLTIQEIKQIYNGKWANENEKKMFLLAVITGMRIGEISALMKENVHCNYLDVKYSFARKFGLGSTKTHLSRYVPIPEKLNLITNNNSVWIFDNETNDNPIMSHAVYNCFVRICDKIGIDRKERGITIHSLRNFFISYLQSENVPEPKIRAVVGHAEETMTDLYTYWKPDMFPEVYEAQLKLYQEIKGGLS